jgi:branched-chain amino acid transport system permease protein
MGVASPHGHDALQRGGVVIDTTDAGAASAAGRRPRPLGMPGNPVRLAVTTALILFVVFGLPQFMSLYYTGYMTLAAIYAVVALGLGLLVGRVGLFSLGQGAVVQIGAWVAARLLFATSQPYPVVLLEAGLVTMLIGTAIGLPALRMRGLYLALITLMLAGAITVVLATINFPNGGHGFTGYDGNSVHIPPIRRPSIAGTDAGYFRYAVIVGLVMFALVYVHLRMRPGRAWAAIRQSEPAALAAGINTTFYKLWAFALASFITGVAGGVLAGQSHYLYSINFTTQDSITLLAVALMGGAYNMWGAVVAALLMQLLPAVLQNVGVAFDWLTILFGVGVLQVLTTAPAGLADQFPRDMRKLGGLIVRLARGGPKPSGAPAGGESP